MKAEKKVMEKERTNNMASSDELHYDKLNKIRDDYSECKIDITEFIKRLRNECGITNQEQLDFEEVLAEDGRYERKLEVAKQKEKSNGKA